MLQITQFNSLLGVIKMNKIKTVLVNLSLIAHWFAELVGIRNGGYNTVIIIAGVAINVAPENSFWYRRLSMQGVAAVATPRAIFIIDGTDLSPSDMAGLIAHELTHVRQMREYGAFKFQLRYNRDIEFRINAELEAYRQQFISAVIHAEDNGIMLSIEQVYCSLIDYCFQLESVFGSIYGKEMEAEMIAMAIFSDFFEDIKQFDWWLDYRYNC